MEMEMGRTMGMGMVKTMAIRGRQVAATTTKGNLNMWPSRVDDLHVNVSETIYSIDKIRQGLHTITSSRLLRQQWAGCCP